MHTSYSHIVFKHIFVDFSFSAYFCLLHHCIREIPQNKLWFVERRWMKYEHCKHAGETNDSAPSSQLCLELNGIWLDKHFNQIGLYLSQFIWNMYFRGNIPNKYIYIWYSTKTNGDSKMNTVIIRRDVTRWKSAINRKCNACTRDTHTHTHSQLQVETI